MRARRELLTGETIYRFFYERAQHADRFDFRLDVELGEDNLEELFLDAGYLQWQFVVYGEGTVYPEDLALRIVYGQGYLRRHKVC